MINLCIPARIGVLFLMAICLRADVIFSNLSMETNTIPTMALQ